MKPGAMARALLYQLVIPLSDLLTGNHIKALKAPAGMRPAHTFELQGGPSGNTPQLMDWPECSGGAVIRVTI